MAGMLIDMSHLEDINNWYLKDDLPLLSRVSFEDLPKHIQYTIRLLRGDIKVKIDMRDWHVVYGRSVS